MKPLKIIWILAILGLIGLFAWRWTRPPPIRPDRPTPSGPHEGRISALGPSVSGDVFGRIVQWQGDSVANTWIAHDGALRALLWEQGDLVSVGADRVARWGPDGALKARFRLPEQGLNDGVLVPGGVAVAGIRGTVAVLEEAQPRWQARGVHGTAATAVWFDGTRLYSGGADGRVLSWDVATGIQQGACRFDLGVIIALIGDEQGVLVVARHGLARCRESEGSVLATWTWRPTSVARWGTYLAIGTEDGVVDLRNPLTGKEIQTIDTGEAVLAVWLDAAGLTTGGRGDGQRRRWPLP